MDFTGLADWVRGVHASIARASLVVPELLWMATTRMQGLAWHVVPSDAARSVRRRRVAFMTGGPTWLASAGIQEAAKGTTEAPREAHQWKAPSEAGWVRRACRPRSQEGGRSDQGVLGSVAGRATCRGSHAKSPVPGWRRSGTVRGRGGAQAHAGRHEDAVPVAGHATRGRGTRDPGSELAGRYQVIVGSVAYITSTALHPMHTMAPHPSMPSGTIALPPS